VINIDKLFNYTTILTIFLLILFSVNMIKQTTFVILFIPLSLCVLAIGVIQFKKTIKNRNNIEEKANAFKNLLEKRIK
jgi:L-asparagine transporter-like permease